MIRGRLKGTALNGVAGRRLCHSGDIRNASATATTKEEEESSQPVKETMRPARLWAMPRFSQRKTALNQAMKAWRIPACLDFSVELPPDIGPLLYLDRLQVHQYYWKLGSPGFVCTKFCMDIYDPSWAARYANSTVIASLDVYPQRWNYNREDDIINMLLVSPKQWGMRCPISFSGEQDCIGVKKGGIFKKDLTFLAFDCDLDLPAPKISLDVINLDIGGQVRIQDLNLNLQLRSNLTPSTVICEVLSGSSS